MSDIEMERLEALSSRAGGAEGISKHLSKGNFLLPWYVQGEGRNNFQSCITLKRDNDGEGQIFTQIKWVCCHLFSPGKELAQNRVTA